MNSIVGDIVSFLETSVQSAIPSITKSKHYYNFNKNDAVRNEFVFAVRPGRASSVNGVTRSVTVQQDFEIQISRDYVEKSSDDLSLRAAIDLIYRDNETIFREVSLRKGAVSAVLMVGIPSFDQPDVNENQKSVSIVFTYPITYRKSIKGDA